MVEKYGFASAVIKPRVSQRLLYNGHPIVKSIYSFWINKMFTQLRIRPAWGQMDIRAKPDQYLLRKGLKTNVTKLSLTC